jgi:hypothetical protein
MTHTPFPLPAGNLCLTLLRAVDKLGDWGKFSTPTAQELGTLIVIVVIVVIVIIFIITCRACCAVPCRAVPCVSCYVACVVRVVSCVRPCEGG